MHTRFGWRDFRVKPPLGGHKRRWENNIKMDLQEVGCGGGAWTGLIWLRIRARGGLL